MKQLKLTAEETNLEFVFGRGQLKAGLFSNPTDVLTLKPFIEQIGTKKFEKEIGRKENMHYDKDEDCYICHNNKKLRKVRSKAVKTASGYLREETHHYCREYEGCPYRGKCMSGNNREKPLEKRYKKLVVSKLFEELRAEEYRLIDSEEGKKLRMNRSIQAEGGFADIKEDSLDKSELP